MRSADSVKTDVDLRNISKAGSRGLVNGRHLQSLEVSTPHAHIDYRESRN